MTKKAERAARALEMAAQRSSLDLLSAAELGASAVASVLGERAAAEPAKPVGRPAKNALVRMDTSVLFNGAHSAHVGEAERRGLAARKVLVSNCPVDVTEGELRGAFGFAGEIESVRIMNARPELDPASGGGGGKKVKMAVPRASNYWGKEKVRRARAGWVWEGGVKNR